MHHAKGGSASSRVQNQAEPDGSALGQVSNVPTTPASIKATNRASQTNGRGGRGAASRNCNTGSSTGMALASDKAGDQSASALGSVAMPRNRDAIVSRGLIDVDNQVGFDVVFGTRHLVALASYELAVESHC